MPYDIFAAVLWSTGLDGAERPAPTRKASGFIEKMDSCVRCQSKQQLASIAKKLCHPTTAHMG